MSETEVTNLCDNCLVRLFNKTPGCATSLENIRLDGYGNVAQCKTFVLKPEVKETKVYEKPMIGEPTLTVTDIFKVMDEAVKNITDAIDLLKTYKNGGKNEAKTEEG
jgi:hypothetical protein